MQQVSLQSRPILRELLYIADGSFRMHLMLSAKRQLPLEDVVRFKTAVRAILICTLYSTLDREKFVEQMNAYPVFREFIGLPEVNWSQRILPLFNDMQCYLFDDCVRGLLLAIVGAAHASGALSHKEFKIDRPLLLKWAAETYQIPGFEHQFPTGFEPPQEIKAVSAPVSDDVKTTLTDRQLDVLRHLVRGKSNKGIGNALGITEGTVKIHLAAIFKTFKVKNRTEAAMTARNF